MVINRIFGDCNIPSRIGSIGLIRKFFFRQPGRILNLDLTDITNLLA